MSAFNAIIENTASEGIDGIQSSMPGIGNFIVNQISEDFAQFVRDNYLSGQVLGVRTGETRESTRFFKSQPGVFGVRPGVGVRGSLNYLNRFERGALPFMGPAYRAYTSSGEPERIGNRIMGAIIDREGLS